MKQRVWNIAETNSITVFPDIIVHQRGVSNNLLVIEIKKSTSKVGSNFDYSKLKEFKSQHGYSHALFLRFITGCTEDEVGVDIKDYLP
jgi:hypothetical protein